MAAEESLDIVQPENTGSSENGHHSDIPAEAPPAGEYMGVGEAGRQLRMPEQAIRHYVKKGLLEGKREGKEWLIARHSVDKFGELLDGSHEGYAWLFQDYNKLLNNYLELIRENNRLSEQVGFLKAKEKFLIEYRNSLEAKTREAESLRRSLVRSERISRALQAVAEELEERNTSLLDHHAQAGGRGSAVGKAEPDEDAGEADHSEHEWEEKTLNGAAAPTQEGLKELSTENRELTEHVGALSEEAQRMKDRNDELTQELARLYGELRDWRNMSFWRRVFLGRVR